MHRFKGFALVLAFAFPLAACVHTQEMQLAPNVVRLDTQASGRLWVGQAGSQTLQRAAQVTLQNGYTHFRLEQAQMSSGTQLGGVVSSGYASGTGVVTGNFVSASATGSSFSTPIYRPTSDIGVTVVMFHANEAGAQGAFDAAAVLKKMASQ